MSKSKVWKWHEIPAFIGSKKRQLSEVKRKFWPRPRKADTDPNVWTGCVSQVRSCGIAEVADIYPACLIGSRAVALMGIRTLH